MSRALARLKEHPVVASLVALAAGLALVAGVLTNARTIYEGVFGRGDKAVLSCAQQWVITGRLGLTGRVRDGFLRPVSDHLFCVHKVVLENHGEHAAHDVIVQLENAQDGDEVQVEPLGEQWQVRKETVKEPFETLPGWSRKTVVVEGQRLVKGLPVAVSLWRRCPPVVNLSFVRSAASADGRLDCGPAATEEQRSDLGKKVDLMAASSRAQGLLVNPSPEEDPLRKAGGNR
jgi:hypothetical protein